MRYMLLLALIFLLTINATAQTAKTKWDLYRIAVDKFAEEVDAFYAKSAEDPDWSAIFLSSKEFFFHSDSIKGRRIVDLEKEAMDRLYASHDNKLLQVLITQPSYESDTASVTFQAIHSEYYPKEFTSRLGASPGWTTVFFRFNCEAKGWTYEKCVTQRLKLPKE